MVRAVRTALIALGLCLLAACGRSVANDAPLPRIPSDVHSKVKLGETTPAAVEQLFGTPDQRAADGALVYESQRKRPSGKLEKETTTFRFEGGVLSKVCQSRS